MARDAVLAEAGRLSREGDPQAVLRSLRDALRRRALGPEAVYSAGRLILRALEKIGDSRAPHKVLILGQCTTSWLTNTLAAISLQHDLAAFVRDGPYDNVLQALAELTTADSPDVLVLLPWNQRLLGGQQDGGAEGRIAQELAFWRQVWGLASERGIKRLVQVGYDWIGPGAQGYHLASRKDGEIDLVRRTNGALREALPESSYFVPLEELSGTMGRRLFYDYRRYDWTRQPFSEAGLVELAEHIVAGIRSLTTGPRKVLVLDLDDTLWGGVVGEVGPQGIVLGEGPDGEAFMGFQTYLKELARRGVLLAICSKNNPEDARGPFEQNPDMKLRLDDFAHFAANWESKADNLRRIAEDLGLGLDSFVFFDDNPSERELIRQCLPQVEVVDVPPDPSDYVAALQAGLWFESSDLTNEDRQRTALYRAEGHRRGEQAAARNVDEYLVSLAMKARLRPVNETDMPRVVQLLGKTNQFNLTTRRHTAGDVRRLLAIPGSMGITLRLEDRFSDYGLVAVILAAPTSLSDRAALKIDTFLMSCRVIGRKVENVLVNGLLRRAADMGYSRVVGEFLPTEKNKVVSDLYQRLGFSGIGASEQGGALYEVVLPARNLLMAPVETID